jgi:hypothetical protein
MEIDVPDIASPHDIRVNRNIMTGSNRPTNLKSVTRAVIFPNPFQDRFSIASESPVDVVRVYDSAGRVVFTDPTNHTGTIYVSATGLSAGGYVLELIFQDGMRQVSSIQKVRK